MRTLCTDCLRKNSQPRQKQLASGEAVSTDKNS